MRKTLGVLFLVACGDPRVGFVGHYSGSETRTTQTSGGASVDSSTGAVTITAPTGTDRLQFDNGCMWTARVETGSTIQFDPVACPTFHGTSKAGVAADFTDSIKNGTGTLTNKTLVIDLDGEQVGTNYADGTPTQTYDFTEELTVTRQ